MSKANCDERAERLAAALREIAGAKCARLVLPYACRKPPMCPRDEWCLECIAADALADVPQVDS